MKFFGAVLRGIREHRKLKPAQVGAIIGLSASTISSIESGQMPQMTTYLKLCRWMGIKASTFLDLDDDDVPASAELEQPEAGMAAEHGMSMDGVDL